ncbi:hypothetical protein N9Y67_03120 [Pseudomonadota bacterium]|nr:hypothetical protein [Pseudomonadota bacterium]
MSIDYQNLEKQLEIIPKILKVALQLGIGIGALIIIIYSGKVGYYPNGLTIGDGLLFIAVAFSFGLSYSIVVLVLYCTVILLTPFWRVIQFIILQIYKLWLKIIRSTHQPDDFKFPPLTSDKVGLAFIGFIGLIIIALSYKNDPEIFWSLIASIFLMAFCYLLYNSLNISENDSEPQIKSIKKVQLIFVFAIYLIPIVIGKFQGNVLDQTMRLIGVRSDSAIVTFEKTYQPFVNELLKNKTKNTYEAKILYSGLGGSSVIEINEIRFVVPNTKYSLAYVK